MKKNNVTTKTERLLNDYPILRNSDKKLLLTFWEKEGLQLTSEQQRAFLDCTPAESITRARRALRNKYPASPQIEKTRYGLAEQTRDQYSPRLFGDTL